MFDDGILNVRLRTPLGSAVFFVRTRAAGTAARYGQVSEKKLAVTGTQCPVRSVPVRAYLAFAVSVRA